MVLPPASSLIPDTKKEKEKVKAGQSLTVSGPAGLKAAPLAKPTKVTVPER